MWTQHVGYCALTEALRHVLEVTGQVLRDGSSKRRPETPTHVRLIGEAW